MFSSNSAITGSLARIAAVATLALVATCGGDTGTTATVTPPAVATVEVLPSQRQLNLGETVALSATLRDKSGAVLTGRTVSWSSSAATVARVDASAGIVTAAGSGTAAITASSEGVTGSASIVVIAPVATVAIDSVVPQIYVGRTAQLTLLVRDANGGPITDRVAQWSSSVETVATVSGTGLVSGIAVGTSTITATVDGKSATRVVLVQAIPTLVVSLSPASAFVPRGVAFPLTLTTTDFVGQPITGLPVTYSTNDANVATVSPNGVVTPLNNGAVAITASVNGVSATARLIVMTPRTITGQVMTADGGSPLGMEFIARIAATGQKFSTPINGAGQYSLTLPLFDTTGPPLEFYVDAPSAGSGRRYHPSYLQLGPGLVPATPRILLIPHFITPDSGTYAGQSVTVSLTNAFLAVCTDTTDANCQSYWPSYWLAGIKMWPDAARPIPLAIDRTTNINVSATDSVALWATIRNMEQDLGRQLYKPAMFTAYTSPGYVIGMMLVSRDSTVAPFAGYTNWSWDGQGMLYQAKVRLANATLFANSSIVSHELTHGQGFSHTCRWSTVMGGYGCGQLARLSASDVAYYHLAQMVRAKIAAFAPTWSIGESFQGARVIEFGLPPTDAIPRALRPMLARASLPGSDGAP